MQIYTLLESFQATRTATWEKRKNSSFLFESDQICTEERIKTIHLEKKERGQGIMS